jgi:hypothetical protein
VVAFTSVLGRVAQGTFALASLVAPGGFLLASFLGGEAPRPSALEQAAELPLVAGPVAAGQDALFLLCRQT